MGICVSTHTTITYRPPNWRRPLPVSSFPPQFHNPFPGNKKRCVLITQHWHKTQGCPLLLSHLHDIKLTQPQRETHTTFWPRGCEQFCQKNPWVLTKKSHTFHMSQSLQVRQVSKQIRQQNSTTENPLPLSVSPLLSQKWFTPPKNRVFLHGWFEEAQVCCVFRANACA